jgi:hypothetical protein
MPGLRLGLTSRVWSFWRLLERGICLRTHEARERFCFRQRPLPWKWAALSQNLVWARNFCRMESAQELIAPEKAVAAEFKRG